MFKILLTLLLISSALFDSAAPEGEAPAPASPNLNPFFRFFNNRWVVTALCVFDSVSLTFGTLLIIWWLVGYWKRARGNARVASEEVEEAEV
ncbi:hypothetical protein L195_g017136 [Trifolium pratense]|uniref:Uncharacterized protein n=1 Tax=Trifolium pratense TaxID=57577 RepID=A0A2K3MT07_TRIPR|nr:hypothetical protein L195_g017136 [Trifolium pratense]